MCFKNIVVYYTTGILYYVVRLFIFVITFIFQLNNKVTFGAGAVKTVFWVCLAPIHFPIQIEFHVKNNTDIP